MAEYIEREALKEAFKSVTDDCTCPIHLAAEIDQILDQSPAADVDPVRHGRWERIGEDHENCTQCGYIFEALPSQYFFEMNNKFCRMCGAKMDGGEQDA